MMDDKLYLLSFSFPVYARMPPIPTFNPTNATSANITKVSDFTMTILPPKNWDDILNEGWSKFGSALSGFGTLIVTVLTIAGVAGGWFVSRYRSSKGSRKSGRFDTDEYRNQLGEGW